MDPRYFGSNLTSLNEIQADRRRLSTTAGEDAYYGRHTPANGRFLRTVSVVAAAWFGFTVIGSWLQ